MPCPICGDAGVETGVGGDEVEEAGVVGCAGEECGGTVAGFEGQRRV